MRYLIFDTEAEAIERTEKAAVDRGGSSEYTRVWGYLPDQNSDQVAMTVCDDYLDLLTSDELDALVDELPENWLINSDIP